MFISCPAFKGVNASFQVGGFLSFEKLSIQDNFSDVFIDSNLSTEDQDVNDNVILLENGNSAFPGRVITFVNTTFNQSDVNVADDITKMYVNWYLAVNVINATGNLQNANVTIFNTTSGILNMTFNQSYAGKYQINIGVNDSSNNTDSDSFWIFVYDFNK